MVKPAPRALGLLLLPVLAAAMFMVQLETQLFFVRNARAATPGEYELGPLFTGFLVAPMIVGLVFCVPLARLYPRRTLLAAIAICLPSVLYLAGTDFEGASSLFAFGLPLLLAVPGAAWAANHALAGSQLAVTEVGEVQAGASPRVLLVLLLPLIAMGLFILHEILQYRLLDVGMLPTSSAWKRAGMLVASVVAPALLAILFAYPIARCYGRHAGWLGAAIALPTAIHWLQGVFDGTLTQPFSIAAFVLGAAMLCLLMALAAFWMRARLRTTRLLIAPGPTL